MLDAWAAYDVSETRHLDSQPTSTEPTCYGGARLLMEVVEAVSDVWGQDRVGVRLSSLGTFNDMGDDDPETTFGHVAEKLNGGARAYLHFVNPAVAATRRGSSPTLVR